MIEKIVSGGQSGVDQAALEIASEFGISLGAHTSSYENGSVGGEVTKRLVRQAQQDLGKK